MTGTNYDGIEAYNSAAGTNLTIDSTAGTVMGYYYGIEARNQGSGALTITTANVTSTDYDGIDANNAGTSLTIDSTAGTVMGGANGIDAP